VALREHGAMQTFLPYADFARTASVLDPKRLGNQRTEALVIVRACNIPTYGWQHHPAVRMWRGYTPALMAYGKAICDEWISHGHGDTVLDKLLEWSPDGAFHAQAELGASGDLPPWLGDERLHRSHRSNLLSKNPEWYGPRFTDVPDGLEYFWPVGKDGALA
jgi:hypothetical protein